MYCTFAEAIRWIAERDPDRIMREREEVISALEEAGRRMWNSGLVKSWYEGADPTVRAAAGRVNGYLLEQLLRATGYEDWRCARIFRDGERD